MKTSLAFLFSGSVSIMVSARSSQCSFTKQLHFILHPVENQSEPWLFHSTGIWGMKEGTWWTLKTLLNHCCFILAHSGSVTSLEIHGLGAEVSIFKRFYHSSYEAEKTQSSSLDKSVTLITYDTKSQCHRGVCSVLWINTHEQLK